jgi:hypothetical protein
LEQRIFQIPLLGARATSLAQGLEKLGESGVRRAFAVFNNCYQNFGVMNATTMAEILRDSEER